MEYALYAAGLALLVALAIRYRRKTKRIDNSKGVIIIPECDDPIYNRIDFFIRKTPKE